MNRLVTSHATAKQLAYLRSELPQSLLLAGERGVGLRTIARELAGKNVTVILEPQDKKGDIDLENGTITVEMIRRLYEQTHSKHTSSRIVIIDNADRMSHGASGAFLKLLEEPTQHTHFVLTSHQPQNLLPTIRSRVQQLVVQPVSKEQTTAFITSLNVTDATKQRQLEFIANGLPAELHRLATDDDYFASRAGLMADARDFLSGDTYKRIVIINKYQSNRAEVLRLIDSTLMIARRSLSAKPQATLVRQLEQLLAMRERIAANGNAKLQLTRFVI